MRPYWLTGISNIIYYWLVDRKNMKYKHTRKEIEAMLVEAVKVGVGYYSMPDYIFHLIKDSLLAKKEDRKESLDEMEGRIVKIIKNWLKEDRKECKHKWVWNNKLMTNVCSKCNKEPPCPTCGITHTPSPLELPKIHNNFSSIEQYNWAKQITDEVKKLYQYIKKL